MNLNTTTFCQDVKYNPNLPHLKKAGTALAGLAQRLERRPAVQRDPGSVPAKGTYLGCSLSPALVGRAGGSHSMCPFMSMFLSLSLFLSLPPALSEQKMEKCPQVRIKKKKEGWNC
uniref:Uncharacterized protein n=1 Tax=Molossus molossus TaxID=27622 RepID=A0A7J8HMP2_MOLMO|nr:hypothetical protein HJG59_019973 [Molossus molossus]